MGFDFSSFHQQYRTHIIDQWVDRLKAHVGEQYARRPKQELEGTVTEAFDAFDRVLAIDDYAPIDRFIDKITQMRLQAGFRLSDVQKAFELYRTIVTPMLAQQVSLDSFQDATVTINRCLSYTIHRFSDHFQEMHEKEIMEKRIREAERMAYIGRITTSLSHEIRNPLSAVKLNLQILKKNVRLAGNNGRRIDISINQVIRLEKILQELLDFAKPLQMKWAFHPLGTILSSTLELLEMKFQEKNLKVSFRVEKSLPALRMDRDKLRQALINLLLNAVEASDPGGKISVMGYFRDGRPPQAEIRICDEGPGVPEPLKSDIFKPFFTTKNKGTGLGLSMVKRIVEAHGGQVEVADRRGAGAMFKLFLPA